MEINNVLICGLGALGLTYASKLKSLCNLKILANEERIKNYKKKIPTLNSEEIELDYITPSERCETDLIIIATKASGLCDAIKNIENFVTENTIIISLLNGISSEEEIAKVYGKEKVVHTFFIGGSAMREGNSVTKIGNSKIVIPNNCERLKTFFDKTKIDYEISENIIYSQWVKLGVNIILNQPSAIYRKLVGELRAEKEYLELAENLLNETIEVAKKFGIDTKNYKQDVYAGASLVAEDGKTSMLQDVLAKRKTEVEIFSGEIIKLGKIYGIKTPTNDFVYSKIKEIEESYL